MLGWARAGGLITRPDPSPSARPLPWPPGRYATAEDMLRGINKMYGVSLPHRAPLALQVRDGKRFFKNKETCLEAQSVTRIKHWRIPKPCMESATIRNDTFAFPGTSCRACRR